MVKPYELTLEEKIFVDDLLRKALRHYTNLNSPFAYSISTEVKEGLKDLYHEHVSKHPSGKCSSCYQVIFEFWRLEAKKWEKQGTIK